jgi:pantoate--beta-alanine ligase
MKAKKIEPEYIAIADADSLEPLSEFDPNKKMVALIAAKVGNVRLIDNMIIN